MILKPDTSLISIGDFLDIYHKVKQKGVPKFLSLLSSNSKRVANKWDTYQSTSDFWIIPEIKQEWNYKISGNPDVFYEDYIVDKYFKNKKGLRLLSIGCGEGQHERNFARYNCFSEVVGVDLSEKRIIRAREKAKEEEIKITYYASDFRKLNFEKESFDVILFSSSLHHFEAIDELLKNDISSLLHKNGLLVVFEFSGPNRLQWKKHQLKAANELLYEIPKNYRLLYDRKTLKKKVYRPGLIRMYLVDPSEAPDSANLVKAIHNNFSVIEESMLGWNLLHLALKGISHNFLNNKDETKKLIQYLIQKENEYVAETGESDAVFGVYQKK